MLLRTIATMRGILRFPKHGLNKAKEILNRRPFLAIPIVVVVTVFLYGGVEHTRAAYFMRRAEEYRNSARVQTLLSDIDTLNKSVLVAPAAYFCNIDLENLLPDFNSAYIALGQGNNAPDAVMDRLKSDIETAKNTPSFRSYLTGLRSVERAQTESKKLNSAIIRLSELTAENDRSTYCQSLQDALSRTYFLQSISTPEGVSALLPGQVENFQINVTQAQELLLRMHVPDEFKQEHEKLHEAYEQVASILKSDDNAYVRFSRDIERQVLGIDETLQSVRTKASDRQAIPTEIMLSAAALR